MEHLPPLPSGSGLPAPLLLHICCGPCATHVIDLLRSRYQLLGFFYNPNIDPEEEYRRRLDAATRVCRLSGIPLWVPGNRPDDWANAVQGRENDPEGGERCRICFSLRLKETALAARRAGVSWFATTLAVSPHKNSVLIHRAGEREAATYEQWFLAEDFRKRGGFQESVRKSKAWGIYRQRYCGCRFSRTDP